MPTKAFKLTACTLAAVFMLLLVRLWWINCYRGPYFVAMAQNQRLTTVNDYEFARGDFLDRNGIPLTGNAENVLLVFPALLTAADEQYLTDLLSRFNLPMAASAQSLATRLAGSTPFVLARNLSPQQVSTLNAHLQNQTGLFCTTYHPRYSSTAMATHIIGYVGRTTPAEAAELAASGAADTSYIGKSGLEQQYDSILRGRATNRLAVTVDEQKRQTGTALRLLPPQAANTALNIRLTIDQSYQQICEQAMQGKNGGAVLLDVKNGDVLALVSSPGYNPNIGQPQTGGDVYLNKVFSYYPPASVFKLVLAAAALEENIGIDTAAEAFCCTGQVTLSNGHTVNCWQTHGHGTEDMAAALANSCNPYFITLGQKLGGQVISEYAWRLGLCEQVLRGFKVNSANMLNFNPNVPADVANVSIGEKGIRATPLMLARLLCAIANNGLLPEPRLVINTQDASGNVQQSLSSAEPRQVISSQTANRLRQMLANAVSSGTGKPATSQIIGIGGKTGTSQNFGVWFAGFFPTDEPRWAMAVYIADGSSGGKDAGTVCRETAEKLALLEDIAHTGSV